jgi:putative peptidoglycan binding protein/LysM domain-containing protein
MADYYTVKQGDYLSKIAKQNGFPDFHTIWDHPNNAQLKQTRENPNVLFVGDQLFIPDKEQKQESGSTDKRHTFVVKRQTLKLRLVLEDIYEKPIANAQCALLVEDKVFHLTADGKGKVEHEIPGDAEKGFLVITSDQTPFQNTPIPVKIGHLDPVDKISGQIARLNNLGYFTGDLTQAEGASASGADDGERAGDTNETSGTGGSGKDDQFRSAVEEFQCDHGLTVDGICGPLTQAKLKQLHGC